MEILVDPHPLLDAACFLTQFPRPLDEMPSPSSLLSLFSVETHAPVSSNESLKKAVRQLLRHGGFRPSGRSKPASEYLQKAVEEGRITPSQGINLAVDACNVVSFHSGLPISVIDLDLATLPLSLRTCPESTEYVFNLSEQIIRIDGLISLYDAQGPTAGPVKDSQRTKTHGQTTRTVTVIWGTQEFPQHTQQTLAWYRELLHEAQAHTELIPLQLVTP